MDLPVTVGMQQHPIGRTVRAPLRAPDEVVAVPARQLRDRLLTHRTDALLFPPKIQQAAPTLQGIRHLHAQTSFEVALPRRVIRVGLSFNFDVPCDGRVGQSHQPIDLGFALAGNRWAREPPAVVGHAGKVLLANPSGRLVRMSTLSASILHLRTVLNATEPAIIRSGLQSIAVGQDYL
jgi:hypothetical protein